MMMMTFGLLIASERIEDIIIMKRKGRKSVIRDSYLIELIVSAGMETRLNDA